MHADKARLMPFVLLILLVIALAIILRVVDTTMLAIAAHHPSGPVSHVIAGYQLERAHFLAWWPAILIVGVFLCGMLFVGSKKLMALLYRLREEQAGFAFKKESHALPRVQFSLKQGIVSNPRPGSQVFLGVDDKRTPIYLPDRDRSMHVHVLGQTGSGKTKSVIEPLLFQDLRRRRGVCVIDGKGSQDNEERLLAMAALVGRLEDVRLFTLNPYRRTHTYNPVHMPPKADPRAIAERVFSSFAEDMDNPYYRDQARQLFVNLVEALAATGKPFNMLDLGAAIASAKVREHALSLSSDARAKAEITSQLRELGRKVGETFTGLRAAVARYNHPAVNAYAPDIVLETELDAGGIVAFFLPVNYYKQLARYIGLCVLQHVQQVGALRQLDRSRSQSPVYVYADEFYSFAYEGFTDSLNKSRDANISFLLSHQSFSDLEKVSPEYARGVWDNTRTKIMLYQNDPDVCERLAKALGTKKDVKLTVRRSADGFLNNYSTLEASSREVDDFRLHPNRIKSLECGQAYLAHDAMFVGVNLRTIPDALFAEMKDLEPPTLQHAETEGLGLHALFVKEQNEQKERGGSDGKDHDE